MENYNVRGLALEITDLEKQEQEIRALKRELDIKEELYERSKTRLYNLAKELKEEK